MEESLIEMYLAEVSVRRVETITEALWGTPVSASTVSRLNHSHVLNIGGRSYRLRDLEQAIHLSE